MALFRKMGKLLKNSGVNYDLSMSTPSVFQATRFMSSAKLFVGGLSYNTDETSLRKHFARYGEVLDAKIIMDRNTGSPQGFGFITFATTEQRSAALQTINLAIKTMKNNWVISMNTEIDDLEVIATSNDNVFGDLGIVNNPMLTRLDLSLACF